MLSLDILKGSVPHPKECHLSRRCLKARHGAVGLLSQYLRGRDKTIRSLGSSSATQRGLGNSQQIKLKHPLWLATPPILGCVDLQLGKERADAELTKVITKDTWGRDTGLTTGTLMEKPNWLVRVLICNKYPWNPSNVPSIHFWIKNPQKVDYPHRAPMSKGHS